MYRQPSKASFLEFGSLKRYKGATERGQSKPERLWLISCSYTKAVFKGTVFKIKKSNLSQATKMQLVGLIEEITLNRKEKKKEKTSPCLLYFRFPTAGKKKKFYQCTRTLGNLLAFAVCTLHTTLRVRGTALERF